MCQFPKNKKERKQKEIDAGNKRRQEKVDTINDGISDEKRDRNEAESAGYAIETGNLPDRNVPQYSATHKAPNSEVRSLDGPEM